MCNHHNHEAVNCPEKQAVIDRRRIVQGLAAGGLLTISGPALTGCATNPETGRSQFTGMVSDAQLNQMAASSWAEQKKITPETTDPRYTSRLKSVGARISKSANRGDKNWEYAVFDEDTKNAFVLPGNKVGFYRGMMDFTDTDDQIAAIMGHEVGHVTGLHVRERVSQQMIGQLAVTGATIAGGAYLSKQCKDKANERLSNYNAYRQSTSAPVSQSQYLERVKREYAQCMGSSSRNTQMLNAALGLGYTVGIVLPFSRKHESESDLLGAKYMHKAGYDPYQAVALWEKMAENSPSRQPEWLSTHPDPNRRAKDLHDYIKYQEKLGSQGWESIKIPDEAKT